MSTTALRLLSPSRSSPSSSSSSSLLPSTSKVTLDLNVQSYGSVFMPLPNLTPGEPRTDVEFHGDLNVIIPPSMGARRCTSIVVGIRTKYIIDARNGKAREEGVMFESRVELLGSKEGVRLDVGSQRFEFTLIIPGNLPPHDYHPTARVDNRVFAELIGINPQSTISSFVRSPFASRRGSSSNISVASRTPSPRSSSPSTPPSPSLNIIRQDDYLPHPPAYSLDDQIGELGMGDDVEWIRGVMKADRLIKLIYNPDPAGGVSRLDVQIDDAAPGLGVYKLQYQTDEWTIGSALNIRLTFPSPSPLAKIYHLTTSLLQTTQITSPKDPQNTHEITISPVLFQRGTKPPPAKDRVDINIVPTLWRAGGIDEGFRVTGLGQMPNDYTGRPTTLEGVETPIKVSHKLVTDIWYSVYGEKADGSPLDTPGEGEMRVCRIFKPVIVPACFLIPEVLNLPIYIPPDTPSLYATKTPSLQDTPCPGCNLPPSLQFCLECPTSLPHPRHDHPPSLVGNNTGVCPVCSLSIIPCGLGGWRDCACGLRREGIIERMGVCRDGCRGWKGRWDGEGEGEGVDEVREREERMKLEGERGRRMTRD